MNCSRSLMWPNTKPCGVFGTCVEHVCVCQDGFTAFGDFSIFADNLCDIHVTTVIVLWVFVIVMALLNLGAAVWGIASRGMRIAAHAWRGWSLSLLSFAQTAILLGLAIPKIIFPTTYIVGSSVPCTILHGAFILVTGAHLFITMTGYVRAFELHRLSHFGPETRAKFIKRIYGAYIAIAATFIGLVPVAFVPLALITQPDMIQIIVVVHGLPMSFALVLYGGYIAPRLLDFMLEAVTASLKVSNEKRSQLERIAFKLRSIKRICMIAFPAVTLMIVPLALWPFLTVKTPYLLPFFFMLCTVATTLAIWGTITTATNAIRRPSTSLPFFSRLLRIESSPEAGNLKRVVDAVAFPSPEPIEVTVEDSYKS